MSVSVVRVERTLRKRVTFCALEGPLLVLIEADSEDEAYALMARDYNPRCQPPWTPRDLRRKVREAYRQGRAVPVGAMLEERR